MTLDLFYDFKLRGNLRINPTAMVQNVKTDVQTLVGQIYNYLKVTGPSILYTRPY